MWRMLTSWLLPAAALVIPATDQKLTYIPGMQKQRPLTGSTQASGHPDGVSTRGCCWYFEISSREQHTAR